MKKLSLVDWIRKQMLVAEPGTEPGNCTAISLVHSGTGKEVPPIFKFGGKQWKAEDLAEMFQNRADNYSEGTDNSQRFELLAFYENRTTPEDTFIFISHKKDLGFFDEGPSDTGVKQQAMRHLEVAMRMALEQTGRVFEASARAMSSLTAQNEQLMKENHDSFNIVKELIIEKANAQFDREIKLEEFKRSTAERRKWMTFGPPLINSIFGREIFPQSVEDTALIEGIADALPYDAIQKIAALLPPELWGPLSSRMERFLKEKRAEEESAKRLAEHAARDPEADAAGDVIDESKNGNSMITTGTEAH